MRRLATLQGRCGALGAGVEALHDVPGQVVGIGAYAERDRSPVALRGVGQEAQQTRRAAERQDQQAARRGVERSAVADPAASADRDQARRSWAPSIVSWVKGAASGAAPP